MNTLKHILRLGFLMTALLLFAAACQSDEDPPDASPVPTETPVPTRGLPPTWTPAAPTEAVRPNSTLVPTFTPRPTLTATPGVTPGVALLDDGSLSVIVEAQELNDAISTIYQNAPPEQLSMAPAIRFPLTGRAVVDLVFFNSFLNERGTVTATVLIEAQGGNLVISEIVDDREQEGFMVADESIRQALALTENAINNAIAELAQSHPGDYQIVSAQVHIERLDVVLKQSGEVTPVG